MRYYLYADSGERIRVEKITYTGSDKCVTVQIVEGVEDPKFSTGSILRVPANSLAW